MCDCHELDLNMCIVRSPEKRKEQKAKKENIVEPVDKGCDKRRDQQYPDDPPDLA